MLCGWDNDCMYDKNLNATVPMLQRALRHLEENFTFVGLYTLFSLLDTCCPLVVSSILLPKPIMEEISLVAVSTQGSRIHYIL